MNNSLAKNATYKAILNIFNLFVPLIIGVYIARVLSVELLGMYNRVYSEFQVFFTLSAFGIYNFGLREISKFRNDKKKVNKIFTNLFLIGIITNLSIGFIYIIYFMFRATGADIYIYALMMIQIIGNIFYIEFINEAVENYGFIAKKTIIIRLLYLVGIFVFVKDKSDVFMYALVINLTVFLNNFVSFRYLKKQISFDFTEISLKRYIYPLTVAFFLTNVEILYSQFDKLMIGWFYSSNQELSDIAVSMYFIPYNLVGMIGTIPLSLVSVAIPRLSLYIGQGKKKQYEDTLNNTVRVFMAMIIPICFGLMALAKEVMFVYAGEEYISAYPVLIVAAICRFAFAYQSIYTNLIMYVNNLEKELVSLLALFGFCNVMLDFIVWKIGIMEPIWLLAVTGISVLLFDFSVNIMIKKRLDLKISLVNKSICGYAIVSFLFLPISFFIHMINCNYWVNIIVIMTICILLYGGWLWFTKDPVLTILVNKFKLNHFLNFKKRIERRK